MSAHFIFPAGRLVGGLKISIDGQVHDVAAEEVAEMIRHRERRNLWRETERRRDSYAPKEALKFLEDKEW